MKVTEEVALQLEVSRLREKVATYQRTLSSLAQENQAVREERDYFRRWNHLLEAALGTKHEAG